MIVDASVVAEYLSQGTGVDLAAAVLASDGLVAPHLIDAEVGHVLRAHARQGRLDPGAAAAGIAELPLLGIERLGHTPLVLRAWELRDNLSFYDALYVTLAEELDMPLVTFDGRIAGAPAHRAEVVVLSA
ncbi:MAG: type II toxin-antitoxin system VapC family toxin [Solirubrobacteraceae bacterium]|nr:type II toxin-antitoxin system VapC family toxin [Solirubrobacteraceae bacterium]